MASFLTRVGLWLARAGGWAPEHDTETCPERLAPCPHHHFDLHDQQDLDDARAEIERLKGIVPEPCPLKHCEGRHWQDADQGYVDGLLGEIHQAREQLEAERLKTSPVPDVSPALLMRTKQLCEDTEGQYAPGFGEAKRHAVFARLLKEFPACPKRQLGLAIELQLP